MMNTGYPILPSRPIHPHIATICSNKRCNVPLEFPVPNNPLPRPGTVLQARCFACQNVLTHAFYPGQIPQESSGSGTSNGGHKTTQSMSSSSSTTNTGPAGVQPMKKGRKIGTQERPLETGYYDILGVPVNATTDDIKRAYSTFLVFVLGVVDPPLLTNYLKLGRLAIKHHPDKNPSDPHAEDRFKEIAIAYQTLSDDTLRRKYNEFGPKESAPEGGYVDPEEVFGAIFGGERFVSIIGNISLAKDMKSALQEAEEGEEGEGEEQGGSGKLRLKDAKGRDIVSVEEKAKMEEKARIKAEKEKLKAAEVRDTSLVVFYIYSSDV